MTNTEGLQSTGKLAINAIIMTAVAYALHIFVMPHLPEGMVYGIGRLVTYSFAIFPMAGFLISAGAWCFFAESWPTRIINLLVGSAAAWALYSYVLPLTYEVDAQWYVRVVAIVLLTLSALPILIGLPTKTPASQGSDNDHDEYSALIDEAIQAFHDEDRQRLQQISRTLQQFDMLEVLAELLVRVDEAAEEMSVEDMMRNAPQLGFNDRKIIEACLTNDPNKIIEACGGEHNLLPSIMRIVTAITPRSATV